MNYPMRVFKSSFWTNGTNKCSFPPFSLPPPLSLCIIVFKLWFLLLLSCAHFRKLKRLLHTAQGTKYTHSCIQCTVIRHSYFFSMVCFSLVNSFSLSSKLSHFSIVSLNLAFILLIWNQIITLFFSLKIFYFYIILKTKTSFLPLLLFLFLNEQFYFPSRCVGSPVGWSANKSTEKRDWLQWVN